LGIWNYLGVHRGWEVVECLHNEKMNVSE
jgi:hypothetical protein